MKAMSISEALQYAVKQLRPKINDALEHEVLDAVAEELDRLLARNAGDMEMLEALAETSIAERLAGMEA